VCTTELAPDGLGALVCRSCGASWPWGNGGYDFLTDDQRARHRITPTERISAWGYDERAASMVERFPDGFVLDCGAGLRPEYPPNVVNLDVVAYPTTDVSAVGQSLPFIDSCFDAVFSFAVLEHVTDPFACARELARVLKPGGILFAVVPFMEPFHGYPDHYFNMTSSGLRRLFDEALDVVELGVPDPGRPIFALSWFLNSYLNGLEPDIARHFSEMRVKDLIGDPSTLVQQEFVRSLTASATDELAATNYLVAVKPG
jgi:SAM-dependent methyltransferase